MDSLGADIILDDFERTSHEAASLPLASTKKRLVNFIVDRIPLFGLTYGMSFLLVDFLVAGDYYELLEQFDGGVQGYLYEYLISGLGVIMYYTLFEFYSGGRSLGKYITGTKAVSIDDCPLSLNQALKRSLWRIVPFEPFSFLGAPMGWHDTYTGTKVIDLRATLLKPSIPA